MWLTLIIEVGVLGAVIGLAVLFRAFAAKSRCLELSQARFRGFAMTSSDWFWETDHNHRFTYLSEGIHQDLASCIGLTRVEFAADAESEATKWNEHFAVLNRHESFRNFVYTKKIGIQPGHIVSVSGDPFFDSQGRFLGYRGIARDISQQVAIERSVYDAKEAAEAANLAKSQFLANMSHELRTPLNAIIGFSEMLERGIAGPLRTVQMEYAGLIHQSGEHLLDIINDILDLAKVDAGKFELHEQEGIDPRRIIDACISLTKEHAEVAKLHLSTEIEEQIPFLVADPIRLKQILLNLLSNAIKFTKPGGSITLALLRTSEGGLMFEVRDTGRGMTGDEIAVALEPFGQVRAGLDRTQEGTGLGLPLARRLVQLHGGALQIDSEKERGTTVTVSLPVTRVLSDAAAPTVAMVVPAI